MSINEPNKECHPSNIDTLSNCLKIIDEANTKKNTHMNSSHGQAARIVRNINEAKEFKVISAPVDSLDYFDRLLKGEH